MRGADLQHVQEEEGNEEEEEDIGFVTNYYNDQTKVVVYQLCSMISHILRSPPLPIISMSPSLSSSSQASPAAFASLFLGVSVALMLFGSLAFAIGFFLMPLVVGLLFLFYFLGLLSLLGRTILWPCYSSSPPLPPGWRFF